MDFILDYYFDFKNTVFSDGNFSSILKGFLSRSSSRSSPGSSRSRWGLVLALLRQLPGSGRWRRCDG